MKSTQTRSTHRNASANKLTLPTEPLTLWNKRYAVAFLVDSQVAAVTKDNCVCVFAVPVVADGAFAILLLSGLGLAIDRGRRA